MEVSWILRHVPAEARRIADVGCGNGALLDSIGPDRVFGVDPSSGGLNHTAKRHPGVSLMCADGTRLPLSDGSVDVITPDDPRPVHALIDSIKVDGGADAAHGDRLEDIIAELAVDRVLLACTELPLVARAVDAVELISVTELVAKDLVKRAIPL